MRSTLFATAALLVATSRAYEYHVGVGKDETTGNVVGFGFDPSRISVVQDPAGDTVEFEILSGTHRVVSSAFNAPCAAGGPGGFDTQEQTAPAGTEDDGQIYTFTMTEYDTPFYFSDISLENCQLGSVFCINTDEANTTASCAAFKSAAIALGSGATASASTAGASSTASTNSTAPPSASSSATSVPVSSSATSTSASGSAPAASSSAPASGAGRLMAGAAGVGAGFMGAIALF